jgi:hypothetical protein
VALLGPTEAEGENFGWKERRAINPEAFRLGRHGDTLTLQGYPRGAGGNDGEGAERKPRKFLQVLNGERAGTGTALTGTRAFYVLTEETAHLETEVAVQDQPARDWVLWARPKWQPAASPTTLSLK